MGVLHPDAVGRDVIREHTGALVDLARTSDLQVAVPTCGGWRLADLVWHLTEVQDFWAWIIEHRPAGPDDYPSPARPGESDLADLLAARSDALVAALVAAPPADPAWSWSDDHTVAFTIRRQSHEALVHRIDGELAVGRPLPRVDPLLAADGVDELVRVMVGGVPTWASFAPTGTTIRLETTDTGDAWSLAEGRMTGTSPDTGRNYELDAVEVVPDRATADTTVAAPASLLDLWLWGRVDADAPDADQPTIAGDRAGAARLRALVAESTQ